MAKTGDTVRFLNSTGGGVITRIEGRMAYVEEDGFETPVLLSEVVVVMPAGHQPEGPKGAKKMFDQKAYDEGRKAAPAKSAMAEALASAHTPEPAAAPAPLPPAAETAHGDKLNVVLAFEPADIKRLSQTSFNAVLVNDSNYTLAFSLLRRADGERGWSLVWAGEAGPNESVDLAQYTHANLSEIERVAFQCTAYKKDRPFDLKPPVSVSRRLDLTKFHKLHCFRPGLYFDTPVIEVPLVSNDNVSKALEVNVSAMEREMGSAPGPKAGRPEDAAAKLAKRFNVSTSHRDQRAKDASNPRKVLDTIEVDLHISELTDTLAGLDNSAMLQMQLDEVRRVMGDNRQRAGQKIVFIHGKGEGVLRKAVLSLLRKEWPKAEIQDASFQEYGFGATQVTIH